MYYTEIDNSGKIVRSQFVENPDIENYALLNPTNRLVPDTSPNPPEYDPSTEYAERQEPVLGDKVEYIIRQIPGAIKKQPDQQIPKDMLVAQQFASAKNITDTVVYALTNFNTTLQKDIANVFSVGKHLIKVSDNQVSEFYEAGVTVDGEVFPWVSVDLQTGAILDKYRNTTNGLEKYTQDPNAEPVRTYFGGYETVPATLKPLLVDFAYKDSIEIWSVKSYGFIVEYRKQ